MSTFRKIVVLLLLAAFFTTPWASAAGPRLGRPEPARAEATSQALLGRAWVFLASLWSKTGCHIDPDGRCVSEPAPEPIPTAPGDTGCHIDPNGGCDS